MSINKPESQSDGIKSANQKKTFYQSISQSANQLVSQISTKSVDQLVSQSIIGALSQSISQSASQPISQSARYALRQSISKSASHPMSHSVSQTLGYAGSQAALSQAAEIQSLDVSVKRTTRRPTFSQTIAKLVRPVSLGISQ